MTGVFLLVLFDVGLRAPAAPGSIFAVYAQTPGGDFVGITVGVFGAALVSFVVGSILLKMDRSEDDDLAHATAAMEDMKGKKSVASSALVGAGARTDGSAIHHIVFACDAGMGSSAMGASVLRRKIHEAGFGDVTVVNKAISSLTDDYDIVVSHQDLTDRAKQKTGSAIHVSVDNFMGSPRYDEIVELVQAANGDGGVTVAEPEAEASDELLARQSVVLRGFASTQNEAITEAGELLVDVGAVDPSYIASMHEREGSVSTHMGNGLAIPHGTNDAKSAIRRSAISFVRYPSGIDWNGHQVKFVVGIAGAGDDHLALLSNLGKVFVDRDKVAQLEAAETVDEVRRIIG
jgi:PTS system mannitol-specific IIC component